MNANPSISVLMPVHNTARFVAAAMDGILRQSVANLELIVCDDGSTDGSGDIARRLASRDSRVSVLTQAQGGIGAARTACLAAASGEWLANLDADDEALPERLERQLAFLSLHPDCVALGTQSLFVDEDGDELGVSAQPLTHAEIEADLWKGQGTAITHSTVMMRRAAVLEAGGYDARLRVSEDLDLYLRLLDRGRLANLPDRLVRVRRHCGSVSAVGSRIERDNSREAIVRAALRRRGLDDSAVRVEFPPHPASRAEWHAKWAFRAQRNGYSATARKHAWRALRYGPLNPWALRAVLRVGLMGG